jgi:ribonuclease E
MKRMLFNATQAEELRVAIVDGQKLVDLDIESAGKEQRKSNIYKGVITRVEPSLEAAFVDYGTDRHGFLPFKEISRSNFQAPEGVDVSRARIQDVLREGQELIVQVEKDERGTKGAALTTFISLAGRYLVLMPNNPRGGGVSRRIEGDERAELRDLMAQLEVPQGMSIIARTAGIGRTLEELQWDLNYLLQLWKAIENASRQQSGAFLIYQEGSLVIRAIRDYFQPDIGEILIDTESIYDQAVQFMSHVMPNNVGKVKLYKDNVPLFSRFQIEHQIETAYAREVPLPAGGSIVIDHTEALVAVDVNSARATRGADIEQTALNTNLEAADEIARQLRLRDLGGLVVIDFIDMESPRNQREVENRLRDALRYDRARVQTGKISRFGLLELSRQRLQPSLGETSHISCPRCHGTGHIRGTESSALHILRILQEEAMKENTAAIRAQVPVDVATFLLNEKRQDIQSIESRFRAKVILIPNIHMETPDYSVTRLRHDELAEAEAALPSYRMAEMPTEAEEEKVAAAEAKPPRQLAVVREITPAQPAPVVTEEKQTWFGKIRAWLQGLSASKEQAVKPKQRQPHQGERRREPRRETRESRRERQAERGEAKRAERAEARAAARKEAMPAAESALAAGTPSAKSAEKSAAEGQEARGKRGRRGRRERGERPEPIKPIERAAEETVAAPAERGAAIAPVPPVPEAARQEAPQPPAAAEPEKEVISEIRHAPSPAMAPVAAGPSEEITVHQEKITKTETAPAPVVVAQEAGTETAASEKKPSVPRPRKPREILEESAAAGNLIQVETSPEKVAAFANDASREEPREARPRPPRIRQPQIVPEETGPLIQVETQKQP